MLPVTYTALLGLLLTLARAEEIFFIIPHGPVLHSRLDPIVSPDSVSGHVHAIVGSNSFAPEYTYENSLAGQCTSAKVGNDKSNYWMPSMYRKTSTGVKHTGLSYANTYYQLRRQPGEPVYEFPPGFRMMAGDATRNTYDETDRAQAAISYVCLGRDGPGTPEMPKQQCPNGVRAQAYFPHCWDGVNNWLEGNRHVAYGTEGNFDGGGKCPTTHPKRIMGIFFEWIFHDNDPYEDGARVLANGDDLGYSLHADFSNGWPEGFFGEIFAQGNKCDVGFGLKNCPPLQAHLKDGDCDFDGILVDEDIGDNGIAKLPGNNPFWGRSGPKKPDPNYVEEGKFKYASNNGTAFTPSGNGEPYAQVEAGNLHIITVKGDPAYAGQTSFAQAGATHAAGGGAVFNPIPTPVVSSISEMTSSTSNVVATTATSTQGMIASSAGGAMITSSASASSSSPSSRTRPHRSSSASASASSLAAIGNVLVGQDGSASASAGASATGGHGTCSKKKRGLGKKNKRNH